MDLNGLQHIHKRFAELVTITNTWLLRKYQALRLWLCYSTIPFILCTKMWYYCIDLTTEVLKSSYYTFNCYWNKNTHRALWFACNFFMQFVFGMNKKKQLWILNSKLFKIIFRLFFFPRLHVFITFKEQYGSLELTSS